MGARGPNRQPVELNVLRGGRGKRERPAPQAVDVNPALGVEPPRDLRGHAERRWWRWLTRQQQALRLLRETDAILTRLLAETLASYERLAAECRELKTVGDGGSHRIAPEYQILAKEREVCVRLLREMGLTPAARTRLLAEASGAAPANAIESKYLAPAI